MRKVNWREVIRILDELPPETDVLVGILDQSVRSHILAGRYKYIDPSKYNVWTQTTGTSRTRCMLFMSRKP